MCTVNNKFSVHSTSVVEKPMSVVQVYAQYMADSEFDKCFNEFTNIVVYSMDQSIEIDRQVSEE